MLQAMITLKKRQGVEIGLDQITGLTLAFFIGTESIRLDGTQTCGELSLMPGTSPGGAKLGRAACSSTHVAIDMSLKNNAGSLPLAIQRNLPAEITSRCKQCEDTFTISICEQQFFVQKAMSTPALSTRCRQWNQSKALNKPGEDIPKGSSDSRFREALTSWAIKSGWWTEARSIEEKKWTWDAEAVAGRSARAVEKSRQTHITRHKI